MGYKICYTTASQKRKPRGRLRRLLLTAVFFALFLFTAQLLLPKQLQQLQDVFLPVDSLNLLVSQLQQGENIVDAVTAFCHDIIHGR